MSQLLCHCPAVFMRRCTYLSQSNKSLSPSSSPAVHKELQIVQGVVAGNGPTLFPTKCAPPPGQPLQNSLTQNFYAECFVLLTNLFKFSAPYVLHLWTHYNCYIPHGPFLCTIQLSQIQFNDELNDVWMMMMMIQMIIYF